MSLTRLTAGEAEATSTAAGSAPGVAVLCLIGGCSSAPFEPEPFLGHTRSHMLLRYCRFVTSIPRFLDQHHRMWGSPWFQPHGPD